MDKDLLLGNLSGSTNPHDTLVSDFIGPSMDRMNRGELGFRIGKYPDEQLPTNQQNLSDFRVRLGTLLEYELSRSMQWNIEDQSIDDVYASCVVANRFPDLQVRGQDGTLGLRFEVKSIQTIAEEAAANFDTLVKDIRKGKDYIVLMVWNWSPIPENKDVQQPYISDYYLFDAYNIALLRDAYWLNTPGSDEGYQGFDLCDGVTYDGGATGAGYKEEEGNYGKLTRIYNESFDYKESIPDRVEDIGTLDRYLQMKKNIRILSFKDIIKEYVLEEKFDYQVIEDDIPFLARVHNKDICIYVYGSNSLIGKRDMEEKLKMNLQSTNDNSYIIKMNPKFNWKPYPVTGNLNVGKAMENKQNKPNPIKEFINSSILG